YTGIYKGSSPADSSPRHREGRLHTPPSHRSALSNFPVQWFPPPPTPGSTFVPSPSRAGAVFGESPACRGSHRPRRDTCSGDISALRSGVHNAWCAFDTESACYPRLERVLNLVEGW